MKLLRIVYSWKDEIQKTYKGVFKSSRTELIVKYMFLLFFIIVTFAVFPFRIYAMGPALVTVRSMCRTVTQHKVERSSCRNVPKLSTTLPRL